MHGDQQPGDVSGRSVSSFEGASVRVNLLWPAQLKAMTIHIPVWILWALGGCAAVVVLGFAALGVFCMWMFKDWNYGGWR